MTTARRNQALVGGALLVVLGGALGGAEPLTWGDIFTAGTTTHRIFWELRLPRALLALGAGGALAVLGGTYQILLRNPLAEPYVLGVSNAVTLGFAVAEIFFGAALGSAASYLLGGSAALAATLLLLVACGRAARGGRREDGDRVLLFGLGLQFLLSSALFLLLSYHQQSMGGGSLRWFFGQLQWLGMTKSVLFLAGCAIFTGVIVAFARKLDAISLGDTVARSLGVAPVATRNLFLLLTAVFVAFVVSFSGAVGFVGLVIPHVVRLIFRPQSSRALLLASFALGGAFLTFADVLSRTVMPPFEFPVGIFTTILGGPIFLYLLWRR